MRVAMRNLLLTAATATLIVSSASATSFTMAGRVKTVCQLSHIDLEQVSDNVMRKKLSVFCNDPDGSVIRAALMGDTSEGYQISANGHISTLHAGETSDIMEIDTAFHGEQIIEITALSNSFIESSLQFIILPK